MPDRPTRQLIVQALLVEGARGGFDSERLRDVAVAAVVLAGTSASHGRHRPVSAVSLI